MDAKLAYLSIFRLYDVDGDGVASRSEVEHITKVQDSDDVNHKKGC